MRRVILLFSIIAAAFTAAYASNFDFLKEFLEEGDTHVIYVNKPEKKLYLLSSALDVMFVYDIASGSGGGDKVYQKDMCTPAGEYRITEIYTVMEPWQLVLAEERLKDAVLCNEDTGEIKQKVKQLRDNFNQGRNNLTSLNKTYYRAKDGYTRYGTTQDLGINSYGPVFMRLDFPNAKDYKKYRKAIREGRVPMNEDGTYAEIGGGIAIHGTNDPVSIGHDASQGCVRMRNSDVIELSWYVKKGMRVVIR
ncbi:MAG: hypothetical protein CVV21_03985 [Candidatus Goldiibacteriota bacterium HGW-Goldbacteria-1]|jgi:hypothetical protein|nr:MAG: hypothetical protein CVV21_03985 [Candidatus Goldiibacteriota bacterium HGW-Goldbacteria-1]